MDDHDVMQGIATILHQQSASQLSVHVHLHTCVPTLAGYYDIVIIVRFTFFS